MKKAKVKVTLEFTEGKGLTHGSRTLDGLARAVAVSDAGPIGGVSLLENIRFALREALEQGHAFYVGIPGLTIQLVKVDDDSR
jgi:hypothetical protein